MFLKCIPAGAISANCYILVDEKTKTGAVIDPGEFNRAVDNAIIASGMTELKYILCTHGHFDHISGVSALKKKYPEARICVGKEDAPFLSNDKLNLAEYFGYSFEPCYCDKELSHGDKLYLGDAEIKVYSVPGHSPGGVLYILEKENVMFTGDTLFSGSIGRTDMYGGDFAVLMKTLSKFKDFSEDFRIYPGHGGSSTIGYELKTNMYLR